MRVVIVEPCCEHVCFPGCRRHLVTFQLRDHRGEAVDSLDWLPDSGDRLVGIGGAVRNLASASEHALLQAYDLGVQGFVLTREALGDLVEILAELPAGTAVSAVADVLGLPGRIIVLPAEDRLWFVIFRSDGTFRSTQDFDAILQSWRPAAAPVIP